MCKRLLGIGLTLALLLGSAARAAAAGPEIAAPSAVLMDAATGTVLFEKNSRERLPPASVTKVMTLLLVMEALDAGQIGWDDTVSASAAAAAKGGSQIYLEENETLPLTEMLKSVVVASANDCAAALAEHVAGSESAFVDRMNARAAELGMTDTHFVNCTGLDDEPGAAEHLTTAYDIALMSRALLAHEQIKKYTTIWMDTVRDGRFGLANTNKLVRFYDGTTGLKTGYTAQAGYCLSASAERDGMELIAVVLRCASSADRFESAKALLNYGFASYALVTPQPSGGIPSVPVALGAQAALTPVPADAQPLLVEKAKAASVTTEVAVDASAEAPVEKGQRLGTMTLRAGDETLAEIPLVAPEAVARLTWAALWVRFLRAVCMSGQA